MLGTTADPLEPDPDPKPPPPSLPASTWRPLVTPSPCPHQQDDSPIQTTKPVAPSPSQPPAVQTLGFFPLTRRIPVAASDMRLFTVGRDGYPTVGWRLPRLARPTRSSTPDSTDSKAAASTLVAHAPASPNVLPVAVAAATAAATATMAASDTNTTIGAAPSHALPRPDPTRELGRDVVAGCAAGMAVTIVGHPLDTIKTRMQAQSAKRPLYTSSWACARATFQQEGLSGFFRGMGSPLAFCVFYTSVHYATYMQTRRALGIADRHQPAPWYLMLLASVATGVTTTFVRTPMDLLKTQAQTVILQQAGGARRHGAYESPFQCAAHILRHHSWSRFFLGMQATAMRQVVGATSWFLPYEYLKARMGSDSLSVFFCGGFSSWISWTLIYPIDIVKTRLQADALCPSRRRYETFRDCAERLVRAEGVRGLFRGLGPCLLRAFPANAAGILAFESVRRRFDAADA